MASDPRVLGVRTVGDDLLSAVAPLGLAAAASTALVVDLDPDGPAYPGDRTVVELIDEGPRHVEIQPSRSGVAALETGERIRWRAARWSRFLAGHGRRAGCEVGG